jgi:hypothetical protein
MADHYGRYTQIDLTDMGQLYLPWEEDAGIRRPPFSRGATRLALELAATSYDFVVDEWLEAGWTDISIQVENELISGIRADAPGAGMRQRFINEWLPFRARSLASRRDPVTQVRGALRQADTPDTGKGLVMIRRGDDGRVVVAIGFRGTGKRLYDWFVNFDCAREEGMHRGFLRLARQFEENASRISFPQTAGQLGLAGLTLRDVLEEAKRPDSRFLIFLAGHSQGGAVMQAWALRRIAEGVLAQNLLGYGFASPAALWESGGPCLSDLPLYHLINSDDLIPRIGASLHAGRCRVLAADDAFRSVCYRGLWAQDAFRQILALLRGLRDTYGALFMALALARLVETLPEDRASALAAGLLSRVVPETLTILAGDRIRQAARYTTRRLAASFTETAGGPPPEADIARASCLLISVIRSVGDTAFAQMLQDVLFAPHNLVRKPENGMAPYAFMVLRGFGCLQSALWCGIAPPMWDERAAAPASPRQRPGRTNRFRRFSSQRRMGKCV